MSVYSPFARRFRAAVRGTVLRGWKVDGELERLTERLVRVGSPAVFVVHHQNLTGPVRAMALLPIQVHIWALSVFCDREACFEQYHGYTFTERFGWPEVPARLAARVLGSLVPPFLSAFGAIPVYRGKREIRRTMEQSLEALCRGESILICPDRDYADSSAAVGELYRGFLLLGALYRRRTGRSLTFIPLFLSRKEKRLVAGEALCLARDRLSVQEQKGAAARLAQELNELGKRWGDIRE